MNNGSLHMKNSNRNPTVADQTIKSTNKQDNSIDLADVSIISVGLSRYQQFNHRMLTDDEEDIEVDETSDEDDEDEDDDLPLPFTSHSHIPLNSNHDDIEIGPIDPDTQAKLAAILEATGITNSPIPEDFWRDQQVVRLLANSMSSNLNGLHEIANALSSSSSSNIPTVNTTSTTTTASSNSTDKKSKILNKDSSVLLRACVNNDIPTVEKILQRKNIKEYLKDINEDGDSILSLACSNGYTDLVELILRTIPDIAVNDRGNKQDCTPLMEACNAGHYDIVELLIKYNANVNMQSTSGNTALHYAAGGGYVEIVQLLLRHGARVEETNENGHTPLMEAAGGGHVEVTQVLLDHGAGVNSGSKDKNGNESKERKTDEMHTALMEACMDGHVQVARLLLDHGADVNMPPDSYESPLTLSACGGHYELASLLIERGANLEEVNDEGYTPLMEASREGHDDIVSLLISKGANVNRTTEEAQETALTLSCAGGFMDVVKILLTNGADINLGQSTPIMEASQEGHIELVQYLIENGANVRQKTRTDDTALGFACESGHTEVAEILINAGALIDQPENEGRTPLMKAARAGHTCTVRYLIAKGADVNRTTYNNDASVLSLACAGGHFEIATLLLLKGADPNHLLKDRSNCLIEAAKGGHTNIVQLLLEYPKSILNCANQLLDSQLMSHESIETVDSNGRGGPHRIGPIDDDDENLAVTIPQSFPLPSPPLNNASFTLLERLEKIVPRNILEVLKTVNTDSNENSYDLDGTEIPTCPWPSIEQTSSSNTDETSSLENVQQAKKLYLLEQLQNVEKELHDKAQQHLKINQEYRQQVAEHLNNNGSSLQPSTSKKKRTTSSSSTSSSSSLSSTPSVDKPDESISNASTYSVPSQTINFFSSPSSETNPPNSGSSPHHYHSKHKKNVPRSFTKSDRRLEQSIQENQAHLEEMNLHLKNLQMMSTNSDSLSTKTPMRINTDTQKALEHLRQLASNPSALERIQTLANNPTWIKEIQKITSQKSFMEQFKSLSPTSSMSTGFSTDDKRTQETELPLTIPTIGPLATSSQENTEVQRPSSPSSNPTRTTTCCVDHSFATTTISNLRFQNRIDIDCQTESNHDTALTLACTGGHEELVALLLQRNANIEHRDKKGFTPLILAATAGHASIVSRLIEHGANIEAQSERTKDTALSLACSGGRQEVVEVLLKHGGNREHRNVSDYTALSLAASGGYVNIIKLLLSHGAEINSRTGSKLGITPLMLASMNGHVAAVKLLLDMGADINAQIETNRNTALTLACFQGRAEIVSLLVERKANIEHRAKTGLTPLMESASGGYVDVGRVLLEKGADVNATPVPASKDTALTIAADKGHHKFVELLLQYGATIDVRNKKGATSLWLACNGGHLEVVQLLITRRADPDACDLRKVSCLMASFRKGHIKVVKYLVRQVRQFPSDTDCRRLINTIADKDLLKRCQTCMDQIITAKERQAAEANKAANSLLKEIDMEKSREQTRKVAAAKKREKRKAKKKGKQQTTSTENKDEGHEEVDTEEQSEPITTNEATEDRPTTPPSQSTTVVATVEAESTTTINNSKSVEANVDDDDIRLKMMKNEEEQKPSSPEPTAKQSNNSNKKKTTTMTRKMERHQENLASKNKQQQQTETPTNAINASNTTDDGWQEVIGKQKKVTIPHEHYARIIGRSGANLTTLREATGASIEIENKKAVGDKIIVIKGNGDSIKHAHHLIVTLLKSTDTDLTNILPSSSKGRTSVLTSTHEYEEEMNKSQRLNTGPRLQNNESSFGDASGSSRTNPRSTNQTVRKTPSSLMSRSISSSSSNKHSLPLTTTGATWVNSNRTNRAISSSSSSTPNPTNVNPPTWNHPKPAAGSLTKPTNWNNQTQNSGSSNIPSNQHHSHSTSTTFHGTFPHVGEFLRDTDSNQNSLHLSSSSHSNQSVPSSSTYRSTPSSLLVAASSASTNPSTNIGEYNPFASNILTTSLVDVLTKNKEPTSTTTGNVHDESATKMNFANVAKMNVPVKSNHLEPLISTTSELTSPPLQNDPKAAPGYRIAAPSTTPVQQLMTATPFDSKSPTAQINRAPGANRAHPNPVSPSVNKIHLDQNGQTGSSTTSSTSSSPSSFKQPNNYFNPPQTSYQTLDPNKILGPIGSHRTGVQHDDNPLQIPAKFPPSNPTIYHPTMGPTQPTPLLMNPSAFSNSARNRSNLNPTAPEFPHPAPMTNGPLSSNIMNIARMMEQQQQQSVPPQKSQLYSNVPTPVPVPQMPPQASIRPPQHPEIEAMQHVPAQVLQMYHLHPNQQPSQPHLVQNLQPPTQITPQPIATQGTPQMATTLHIANMLASNGQLPPDPNKAAALVAAYTKMLTRSQQPSSILLSSNVNTNVYETISTQPMSANSDELSISAVDPINGQVSSSVLVDPPGIMTNSNHPTGQLLPNATASACSDHKMVPAAIGSERRRHMPASTPTGNNPTMPHPGTSDWSSIAKHTYPTYPPQQPQTRDYQR